MLIEHLLESFLLEIFVSKLYHIFIGFKKSSSPLNVGNIDFSFSKDLLIMPLFLKLFIKIKK